MELCHLRYLTAAVEHGSFRRAAFELGVQESTISRRIRDLEDEIGAALFIRHSSGIHLTLAGQRFFARAKKAIDQLNYAVKDAGAAGQGQIGLLRVGIYSSLASGFLSNLLHRYNATHSSVRMEFVEGNQDNHLMEVRRFRLDVAFITDATTVQGCDIAPLWTERVFVVLPSRHPLSELTEITWSDLRGQPFVVSSDYPGPKITEYLIRHLSRGSEHPSVDPQDVSRDNLMQIVALGRGLTLTSEATTDVVFPGVIYRPISNEQVSFSAVWSPRNDNPAFRQLLSLARSMAKENAPSA
ncbi:LysR family transcriptional regulator [Consotaella salsifontis]|uniref:DNA-binding transcriptional regulator, LysR family n=1 Tax=Consotaella salsifontis TaxID=1365950 RepID=A0A1T4STF5_9HYPH|nr:LysR family transcriptional regulator [Consotaella salsifontis]SKA31457.1 DNA-binding transcriptional regulator, LysR family [Consotaella salsifontis]